MIIPENQRRGQEENETFLAQTQGNVQNGNLFHHSSKCIIACHGDEDIACRGDEDIKSIVMICECLHFRRV